MWTPWRDVASMDIATSLIIAGMWCRVATSGGLGVGQRTVISLCRCLSLSSDGSPCVPFPESVLDSTSHNSHSHSTPPSCFCVTLSISRENLQVLRARMQEQSMVVSDILAKVEVVRKKMQRLSSPPPRVFKQGESSC